MALGDNLKKNVPDSDVEVLDQTKPSSESTHEDELTENQRVESETQNKYKQYCVFSSGNEEYAIPIEIVKEVVKYSSPAPIPQMPDYIIGMSNVRGNIYGVMDLEKFFQGHGQDRDHQYLLVLDHESYKMAIRIADVPDSLMATDEMVEEINSSALKSVIGQKYLKGIIKIDKRMIVLFDILSMISGEKFTVISDL